MTTKVITPTVGRQVWFFGIPSESLAYGSPPSPLRTPKSFDPKQPMAATVLYAWSDRVVNLDVIDHAGQHFFVSSAELLQPGDDPALLSGSAHAEWMPYQVGQAKAAADVGTVGTKTYPDGTTATGTLPLPEQSPTAG